MMQMFTIKMAEGIHATSYKTGDKFFIDPYKLLPLERFLPQPKGAGGGSHSAPCATVYMPANSKVLLGHVSYT